MMSTPPPTSNGSFAAPPSLRIPAAGLPHTAFYPKKTNPAATLDNLHGYADFQKIAH
jgi:hypothetical protein